MIWERLAIDTPGKHIRMNSNDSNDSYLNHPTFGLLYRVCLVEEGQEIFTTLYAQRLFFLVAVGAEGLTFESIGRSQARMMVESRLRKLRRIGATEEYEELSAVHQRFFQ